MWPSSRAAIRSQREGVLARDVGVLRTARTGWSDRQRPRADALLRRHGPPMSRPRLTTQLADPDPVIRRLALQALVTVRGDHSAELARAVMRRLGDSDDAVRTWAITMTKEFPLKIRPRPKRSRDARSGRRTDGPARLRGPGGRARNDRPAWDRSPASTRLRDPAEKIRSRLTAANAIIRAAALDAHSGRFPHSGQSCQFIEPIERRTGRQRSQGPLRRGQAGNRAESENRRIGPTQGPRRSGARRTASPFSTGSPPSRGLQTTCGCSAS